MSPWFKWLLLSGMTLSGMASVACQDDNPDSAGKTSAKAEPPGRAPQRSKQIAPPRDLATPPADATKTDSGLLYKRLVTSREGATLLAGQTAMVRYTGWRQRTGETFFTTSGRDPAIAMDPATAAPVFREVLPLLRKGEKMRLWVSQAEGTPEPAVYEIELVDIVAPTPVIAAPDGARPPPARGGSTP